MPAADQLDVHGVAAVGVAAAELDRDGLVGVAVHEQHLGVRRLVDRGRRALREQALDGSGTGAELRRQPKVAHGRLREHAPRADAIRREQREVPARTVTRECDALRIDLTGQRLDGGDDVVERRGPVAVAVEPAVLDVPDGEAAQR